MSNPEGSLTPAQFEIMQLLWSADDGLPVAEIWEQICKDREVSRTTVLNLVDRLEKRGWLIREKVDGVFHYTAAVDRKETEGQLAKEFVGDFFNGSPSSFVLSLLGTKQISKSELQRLKALLDMPNQTDSKKKGR
ncbi:BlaI/MecI/CopY family transcriptional regulator [Pirellulaceae bacterium SH449]